MNVIKKISQSSILVTLLALSSCSKQEISYSHDKNQISQTSAQTQTEQTEFKVSQAAIGKFGGILRLTQLGQDPKTLNPWIATDASSSRYANLLFDGLTSTDPDTDEVLPELAKSFEILNGGKKIIMHLRHGLSWTDGQPFTADDVLFTWNDLLKDGIAVSSTRDVLMVDGKFPQVSKLDDYTIAFETVTVFAPFLRSTGVSIAPKHDVEKHFAKQNAKTLEEKQKAFNNYLDTNTPPEEIVSSGAFKLHKIKHGERIEFIRNPNYFVVNTEGKQLPYVEKIIYSYVQDQTADIFKFLAAESYVLGVNPSNAALIKSLEKKYDFKLYTLGPSSGTRFFWFNLGEAVEEPKRSWFQNKDFRTAIAYAIDRDSIVNNIDQGLGAALFTAESLKSPFVNKKLRHPRDLAYSRKLLTDSGFKYNAQSELLDKNNNLVEFTLLTTSDNNTWGLLATIIADNLQEIGIKLNIKMIEFNAFVGKTMSGKGYDLGLIGFTGGSEPNEGANVWKSDGRLHLFHMRDPNNPSPLAPWEKEIDDLFNAGVKTFDFTERKKIYDRFQEIIFEEQPLIYLSSAETLVAADNKLGNIRATKYGGVIPRLYELYLK